MNYHCKHCGKTVKRKPGKAWIKSYCDKTGKMVRLMEQDDPWMEIVMEVNSHFKVDKSLL